MQSLPGLGQPGAIQPLMSINTGAPLAAGGIQPLLPPLDPQQQAQVMLPRKRMHA